MIDNGSSNKQNQNHVFRQSCNEKENNFSKKIFLL